MHSTPNDRHDAIVTPVTFSIVPTWLVDAPLSDRAVRLYAVLVHYAGTNGAAWPSRGTLSTRLRCSVDSIDRALRELVDAGAITAHSRFDDGGDQTSNLYIVHVTPHGEAVRPQPVGNPVENVGGGRTGAATPSRTGAATPAAPVRPRTRTTELEPRELDTTADAVVPPPPRPEVEALCTLLADLIEGNGSRRPTIGKAWHDAIRLMIDRDERKPEEVERAIRWSQADEFWRGVILSAPNLRAKYEKMRLQAARTTSRPSRIGEHLAVVEALAATTVPEEEPSWMR